MRTLVSDGSITAPAAPQVQRRHAAFDHRMLQLEALPDGHDGEFVARALDAMRRST